MSKSSNAEDPNKTSNPTDEATQPNASCPNACTITSQTVTTLPNNRARTRIGVGEEVNLTVNPGPATWTATPSGLIELPPNAGTDKSTTIKIKALDKAGDVTITAKKDTCECSIEFEIITPARFIMTRSPGTNLIHNHGYPDCGWYGRPYIQPTEVNFYNIYIRERDSQATGTGAYVVLNGHWHGKYDPSDLANGTSKWFILDRTQYSSTYGSGLNPVIYDTIFASIGNNAGTAPPFIASFLTMPITWEWSLENTGNNVYRFPNETQSHEIFRDGRCTTSKAGHSETTMYTDATSK